MENKNISVIDEGGIKCDNPKCDFVDKSVKSEDLESYLNKPCPKCSENLLTEEDYANYKQLMAIVKMVNSLSLDELEALTGIKHQVAEKPIHFEVETHKELKIKAIN